MPNVLVLGANGYLGLSICQALVRSGNHMVWGLVRSKDKATLLETNEIIPIIGDVTKPETFTSVIESTPIDVVVDTTSAYEQAANILKVLVTASKSRRDALAKESRAITPKLGYVCTSGLWIHGSPSGMVSDLSPVASSKSKGKPSSVIAWRGDFEQAVLESRDILDVAIIRPATLYGRTSYIWGALWGPILGAAQNGGSGSEAIKIPANKEARPALSHVEDVAAGFALAVDKVNGGNLGSWPVFDLIAETVTITEMLDGVAAVVGVKAPVEYIGTMGNPFLEAMSTRSTAESSRAKTILGWEPKRRNFILRLPLYVKAFIASPQPKQ